MRLRLGRLRAYVFACLLTTGPVPAWAQQNLEQLSRNLQDAETSFRYAQAAAAAGDLKGAIAALERVLQINPDLANIKLELGLLYSRAGQADLARSYLEQALNAPDAPEAARIRARQALAQGRSQTQRFGTSGSIFLGAQYQSNPNGSPDTVSVIGIGGVPILVGGDQLRIPRGGDVSSAASAALELRYALAGQRGNDIVADLLAADNEYARLDEIDATYLNARLGPRFFTGPVTAPSGWFRPFASASYLSLGGHPYYGSFGAGVTVYERHAIRTSYSLQLSYERRNYDNSRRRSTATDQTGDYWDANASFTEQVSARTQASFDVIAERVTARRSFWSRFTWGGGAAVQSTFAINTAGSPWIGRLSTSYRRSDYDAVDPLVDPFRKRKENRYDLEADLTIPLVHYLALDLRVDQTFNRASLPNYDFNNTLASAGVTYRF